MRLIGASAQSQRREVAGQGFVVGIIGALIGLVAGIALAAAYVGGVSSAGGVGKVTGSIIGALVMTSLTSGMNLMTIDISYQYIVRGFVLAIAVIFDVATRGSGK